ncbi:MAG: MucR family transcriptional regulator [Syntrophobacteraceae bacterium]|nr:MucR family transcriptional regulator [Syntrophobacteraceae bacterium]
MSRKLIELASEIVQTQVSQTHMTATEITASLRQVFDTLHEMQRAESEEIELSKIQEHEPEPSLKPQDSIQNDKVICLECGAEMRQLTKLHLVSHGLTAKEYKKKYGFTMGTPLTAKSLTKARSKAAKKRGIPENLQKYMEARRQSKAEAATPAATEEAGVEKPKQTRIRKKTA